MKKHFLIIEDNLVELQTISDEFAKHYTVTKVSGIAKAKDILESEVAKEIDCIIIDLNMNNVYLPEHLKPLTHGGSFTGIVWLCYVAQPLLNKNVKVVIYSAFLDELEEVLQEDPKSELCGYYKTIVSVSKIDAVNGTKSLLDEVQKLFKRRS